MDYEKKIREYMNSSKLYKDILSILFPELTEFEPKFKVGDIVQYMTDSTDRRKIEEVDELCNMYQTNSSPIMFEVEDEWKVIVHAEDVEDDSTDFEKKELKKIEQKPVEENKGNLGGISSNSEWSDEDEANLNNIIWLCNNCINGSETTWIPSQATKIKHLIETIKERGLSQQKPTEWSEEDEDILNEVIRHFDGIPLKHPMHKVIGWLVFIKQRIKD